MISVKAIEYLENIYSVNRFEMNFDLTFKDITDDQLRHVLNGDKTVSYWRLIDTLVEQATDKEVKAHLLGWESEEQHQRELAEARKMIESMRIDV